MLFGKASNWRIVLLGFALIAGFGLLTMLGVIGGEMLYSRGHDATRPSVMTLTPAAKTPKG